MRIAVLISGEYRTFKYCRPSMTFLDDANVDVYFSTWNETEYLSPKIGIKKLEITNEVQIQTDLGRPSKIIMESNDSFTEVKYNSKMIHRWITGFKEIKESGINYDYVMITRPDMYYLVQNDFSEIDDFEHSLGVIWANSIIDKKLADITMLSSFSIMDKIFGTLTVDEWVNSDEYDWHIWWYNYCSNKVNIERMSDEFGKCTFYRCFVPENTTDYGKVLRYQEDWRDIKLLHDSELYGRDIVLNNWSKDVVECAERKWASGYYDKYRDNDKDNP